MKTKLVFVSIFLVVSLLIRSQESKQASISLGADIASTYLWRGIPQGTMPALQPWGEFSYKGFTVGAWGSYEISNTFKEVDIYAKYTLNSFSLQFMDFFFPDSPDLNPNYFNFKKGETSHAAELSLSFNGTEKIPFSVFAGMMIYGPAIDPVGENYSKLNNSTYFEVNYMGALNDIDYNVFLGFTPSSSKLYLSSGFSVINVGVSAKKELKLTDHFSLPIKLTLAANPEANKLYMAAVVSL